MDKWIEAIRGVKGKEFLFSSKGNPSKCIVNIMSLDKQDDVE